MRDNFMAVFKRKEIFLIIICIIFVLFCPLSDRFFDFYWSRKIGVVEIEGPITDMKTPWRTW
jgi:hypothetical protein